MILVTGASGFLGRHVVAALRERGHQIRAMVRPAADTKALDWQDVDVFRADLRGDCDLTAAFDDVDLLVHLAACVVGDDSDHLASTVVGTERLLHAMARSHTRRLILASTFSVYACSVRGTLDECSPLEGAAVYERGAYAIAKLWQERITREFAARHNWLLTILRPGIIWGAGNLLPGAVAQPLGRRDVIIGPNRRLPLTYVENCADCFAAASEHPAAAGEVFNVLDDDRITAWQFVREHRRQTHSARPTFLIPYGLSYAAAAGATAVSRILLGPGGKLPSLLMPSRLAVFKPMRFSSRKAKSVLEWTPRWTFEERWCRAMRMAAPMSASGPASERGVHKLPRTEAQCDPN